MGSDPAGFHRLLSLLPISVCSLDTAGAGGLRKSPIMLIPGPSPGNKPPGTRDYLEIGIFQREIKMEIACRKTGKIYMVKFRISRYRRLEGRRKIHFGNRLEFPEPMTGNLVLEYKHRYASVSDSRHAHQRHSGNAPSGRWNSGAAHSPMGIRGQGPSVVGNWCVGLPPENASGRVIILQINPVPFLLRWKLEAGNWQFESAKSAFPGP